MTKHPIAATCASLLLGAAASLFPAAVTHAAVYHGTYDPENENYKWFGTHLFEVDDACLSGGDGWKKVNGSVEDGYCGSARLAGGDLTVVNKMGTLSILDDVSRTIQFSNFNFIPDDVDVWGVNIVDGELAGVDTFDIGAFTFDPGDASTHGGDWYLRWSSGQGDFCDLYFCFGPGGAAFGGVAVPNAGLATVFLTNFVGGDPNTDVPPSTTNVTFQRVPEPGTFGLVGAAFAALWSARRRKRSPPDRPRD